MTLKEFDTLTKRDFENGAVIDEIRQVIKDRDSYKGALGQIYLLCQDNDYEPVNIEVGMVAKQALKEKL